MVTLSHSSIQLYLECPQKWKFKYVDKLPEKPKSFFSFGKSVHSALEFLYSVQTLPPPSLAGVLKFYEEHWISEGYSDSTQEADYKAEGERILSDFYHKHIDAFKIPYFAEYAFRIDVDGVPVRGFVDRIDKVSDDKIAIIDYKTGKAFPLTRVQQDTQLTMYQMACEQLLGLKVESLTFYHLPSQTALTVEPHSKDQVKALRSQIVQVADQINSSVFDPKPEERKCGWCDYKPHCPVFKHQYATQNSEAAEAPVLRSDEELAKLVDRYGKMKEELHEREESAEELKEAIVAALRNQGYVRAFGQSYEATMHAEEKWEFADRQKVLDVLSRAGFLDKILAPSAPMVQKLMKDPNLPLELKDRLQRLGQKVDHTMLRVKRLEVEE